MLGENIKTLRKQKGYSQETFAEQLNVVRQTVSKWEKGYSVPDATMLEKIASILEMDVSVLLGGSVEVKEDTDSVAKQLALINEQLATRNRRTKKVLKIIAVVVIAIVVIQILVVVVGAVSYSTLKVDTNSYTEVQMEEVMD